MKKTRSFDFDVLTDTADPEPEAEIQIKKVDVWAYTKAIMQTKEDLDVEVPQANFQPFLVNRALAFHPDTILIAEEMNRRHSMSHKHQFMYLMTMVRKCKRKWAPWPKARYVADEIKMVAQYYGFSRRRAIEALDILTDDQLILIKKRLDKGTV